MSVICIFGDSITWGAFDIEFGGWVNRLRLYFENQKRHQNDVYNLGVDGDYAADVLNRFEKETTDRAGDTLIFAIGINDSPHASNPSGTNLKIFEKIYRQILSRAKKISDKITIAGLTNVDESTGDHGYSNSGIEKYDGIIKQIASEKGIPFVDLFQTLSIDEFEDGLHPNSKGHEKIFQKVKEVLEKNS